MRSGLTLGIDIGTGSVKATLLDPAAGAAGRGSAAHPTGTPRPGWAEQDPEDWWRGVRAAVRQALQGVSPGRVSAVAVSGQGAALVLVDDAGRPVRPALIHLDQRAGTQAARLAASPAADAVREASGNVIGAWNAAAKLAWVRETEPGSWARTRWVTSAAGSVLSRLAGRAVQSCSDAGISDLFDLGSRTWSGPVLEALGVPSSRLPYVAEATDDLGPLSPGAADELGLPGRVRVVAGGEDTSSAALAAGVVDLGEAYLSLGTAAVVGVVVGQGEARQPALLSFPHVLRGRDLLSGSMSSAGAAVAWCAALTGTDPGTLLAEAERVAPGADGVTFLPYLAGEIHPINDPAARGVFSGLTLATTRAELGRAVIEGSANAIAHNLAVAREAGAEPARLLATGRPTRSPAWMRAVADASGVPVECVVEEGAPMGDAILAAAETCREAAELARSLRRDEVTYEPRPELHRAAAERREASARLYEATRAGGPPAQDGAGPAAQDGAGPAARDGAGRP